MEAASASVRRPAGGQAPAPLTLDTAGRGTASERGRLSSTDATRTRSPSLLPFTGFYNDPLERVKQMRTPSWSAARIPDSRRPASAAQTAAGQAEEEDSEGGGPLLLLRRRRPLRVRDRASRSGGELQQQCRVRRSRVNIAEPDFVFVRVLCAFATKIGGKTAEIVQESASFSTARVCSRCGPLALGPTRRLQGPVLASASGRKRMRLRKARK